MRKCYIFNETDVDLEKEIKIINRLMKLAIKKEELKDVEFNIIFVDEAKIQEINKEYRNIDKVTDVISFALEDDQELLFEHRVLGDIYICVEKAKGQALEYGHSFIRELSFLAVHGFYHLLGYDHMNKEEEEVMFKKQDELLLLAKIERK